MHEGGDDPPRARPSRPGVEADLRQPAASDGSARGSTSTPPAPKVDDEFQDATEIAPSAPSASGGPGSSPSARSRHDSVSERAAKRKEKDPRVGQVLLGRYRLEKAIAKGGMGRVYLATQLQLGRSVAVKILNAEFKDTDPQFVKRFSIEAAISARLSHPNVVTVHDYGEAETGELFMAMELLRGKTLSAAIQKEAPFPPSRTIHIALQIARALRDAHAMGIIHRDLKPGNVMLIEGGDDADFVKVLDFGLVKLFVPEGQAVGLPVEDEEDLTRAGTLLGSPRYMSPEQIRGTPLDPRTDIYSFGIILFQMAAGRPPFTGSGSVDLIYKHIHEVPPKVSEVAHGECPPELEALIARCLEKDREKRFASMNELITALKDARQSITGIIVRPAGDTGPVQSAGSLPPAPPPALVASDRPRSALADGRRGEPALLAGSADETRSGLLASIPPEREAAFGDGGSVSGPIIADPSRSVVAPPSPRRWPMVVGLTAVFAGAALFAALSFAPPPPRAMVPIVPQPLEPSAPAVEPRMVELEFHSEPSGATVKEGDAVLGVTPFSTRFPAGPDGAPRTFSAELDGHLPSTSVQRLDASKVVTLVLAPAPPPSPSPSEETDAEAAPTPAKRRAAAAKKPGRRRTAAEEDETAAEEGDKKKPARYRTNPY